MVHFDFLGPDVRKSHIITETLPLQSHQKSRFEMCFAPSTSTHPVQNTSRIQNYNVSPHFIFDCFFRYFSSLGVDTAALGFFAVVPFLAMWVVDNAWAARVDQMQKDGWTVRDCRVMSCAIHTLGKPRLYAHLHLLVDVTLARACLTVTRIGLQVGCSALGYSACHQLLCMYLPQHGATARTPKQTHAGPAVVLSYMSFVKTASPVFATGLLTLAVGMGGPAHSSYWANMMDVAPRHCAVLLGVSNTIGACYHAPCCARWLFSRPLPPPIFLSFFFSLSRALSLYPPPFSLSLAYVRQA